MTFKSRGFIFMWLLLLARNSLTSGQNHSLTAVTMQQVSSISEQAESHGVTSFTRSDVTPTDIATATQTATNIQINSQAAVTTTPFDAPLSDLNTTAQEATTARFATVKAEITQTLNSTEPSTTAPPLSSSTPTSDIETTSEFMKDRTTDASTNLSQFSKATGTPTKEDKTHGTSSSGTVVASTAWHKTSVVTPFILKTKPKKKQDAANDKAKPQQGSNHGNAVAGIIGGALLLMMVAFVGIYMKKRKMQKQQITTTDWAGPSPFLEAGGNGDQATRRSSNRISLNSFLPQRLSKRLSLLQETDEELEDMTPGITFGGNYQENLDHQMLDGDKVQESNGKAAAVTEKKEMEDKMEAGEDKVSQTSDKIQSTNNNTEAAKLDQNQPEKLSKEMENAPNNVDNGLK